MQVLKFVKRHGRGERAAAESRGRQIESLEPRTLLNATLSTPITAVGIAPGAASQVINLSQHFSDPTVPGTLVDVTTPDGVIPIALTDSKTPNTVANFLQYINNGSYAGTIFHRLAAGFALQAGGFTTTGSAIPVGSAITSESGASNVTDTVAMALTSAGPNSATSQWFVNLANNDGSGTNPNLNNTSDNGPFTVFGNVVYGGVGVVNTIAASAVIDGSSVNSAWNTLPVLNSANGAIPSNEITTNYSIVPALTYTVTSDNPTLVTPSVSGSSLTLAFGSGSGSTQVHVTATDAGGNTTSTSFTVGVGLQTVTVGAGGVEQVQFRDANKTLGHLAITGKGTATVTFLGPDLNTSDKNSGIVTVTGVASTINVSTTGTNATSVLTIWSTGRKPVHISSISTTAALSMLNASSVALDGNLSCTGAISTVLLRSMNNGTMTIGAGAKPTIRIGSADSMSIQSYIAINKLIVGAWSGSGTWNVGSVDTTRISGSFSGNINATKLKKFSAGAITGGTWNITGDTTSLKAQSITGLTANLATVGKLVVNGSISNSTVNATGDVNSFAARSMSGSNLYVATAGFSSGLPTAASEFVTSHIVKSLRVSQFANSNIAAQRLGIISLGTAQTDNGGSAFGIGTQRITSLTVKAGGKTLRLKNVKTAAAVSNAVAKQKVTLKDLAIEIL